MRLRSVWIISRSSHEVRFIEKSGIEKLCFRVVNSPHREYNHDNDSFTLIIMSWSLITIQIKYFPQQQTPITSKKLSNKQSNHQTRQNESIIIFIFIEKSPLKKITKEIRNALRAFYCNSFRHSFVVIWYNIMQ